MMLTSSWCKIKSTSFENLRKEYQNDALSWNLILRELKAIMEESVLLQINE